jgi:hypothetical protein
MGLGDRKGWNGVPGIEMLASGHLEPLAKWRRCIAYQKKKPDQFD